MIDIFRKNIAFSKVMYGMTDCHSHILPGVDDGVQTERDACEILAYFETLGVNSVILTPHIMEDYPLNTNDFLKERFESLCNVYQGSIDLKLAGEYMLNSSFEKRLEADNLLTIFDNHLLIETSYMNSPVHFHELINKIQSKGYHVILAHPERYVYMQDADYKLLKESNVKFQLNMLSLVGAYGKQVQLKSKKLLKKDYYDFTGSDIHGIDNFKKYLKNGEISIKMLNKLNVLSDK